jgi:hypothetical protein
VCTQLGEAFRRVGGHFLMGLPAVGNHLRQTLGLRHFGLVKELLAPIAIGHSKSDVSMAGVAFELLAVDYSPADLSSFVKVGDTLIR